ncbi:MAG: DUF1822 family protein [Leptolyngbya sp. SIO4C5]|nr:DUF1822 family protein [Leptolyngbya sp. SIO4C5]
MTHYQFIKAMNHSDETSDLDFVPWQTTTITLTQSDMNWAMETCQSITDLEVQWQTFLSALAIKGFQHWLAASDIKLVTHSCGNQISAIGVNCYVDNFRLCLLPQGSLSNKWVTVPQSVLDSADAYPHFFVMIEVIESLQQVTILGSLRIDQLQTYCQQSGIPPNTEGTYTIPIHLFEISPTRLMLYLSCLNPAMIAAPAVSKRSSFALSGVRAGLLNASRWLQNQLDDTADQLAWTLMPPLATATTAHNGIRSPVQDLEMILTDLRFAGVVVPPNARGVYKDLQSLGLPFRIYALAWPRFEIAPPEWSLFISLGPKTGEQLPAGTRLSIQDQQAILAEQVLKQEEAATYLYIQVGGNWTEQFTATVQLPDGALLTWPAFIFDPGF